MYRDRNLSWSIKGNSFIGVASHCPMSPYVMSTPTLLSASSSSHNYLTRVSCFLCGKLVNSHAIKPRFWRSHLPSVYTTFYNTDTLPPYNGAQTGPI